MNIFTWTHNETKLPGEIKPCTLDAYLKDLTHLRNGIIQVVVTEQQMNPASIDTTNVHIDRSLITWAPLIATKAIIITT